MLVLNVCRLMVMSYNCVLRLRLLHCGLSSGIVKNCHSFPITALRKIIVVLFINSCFLEFCALCIVKFNIRLLHYCIIDKCSKCFLNWIKYFAYCVYLSGKSCQLISHEDNGKWKSLLPVLWWNHLHQARIVWFWEKICWYENERRNAQSTLFLVLVNNY